MTNNMPGYDSQTQQETQDLSQEHGIQALALPLTDFGHRCWHLTP